MDDKEDWRRMGQEAYLKGVKLTYIDAFLPYSKEWDHEHCSFCMIKFSTNKDDLHSGYCTTDEKRSQWICSRCFEDFKDEFQWVIINK